ncbi:hypothetical protein [Chromobacterium sp. IIBBL 290-4]|uniref:hypothetical protein n=1 Tax=Chromobacterium sp. IIBBL 290-4 TaxID=2953890 RepID=UPI0020B6DAAE|nr:hypothetical protein [Chromobacterium sp. IIBBL 290-4]UTH73444.1 hypothetical protein NKT35_18160 [Chromobacterium sp. IIBBL 290-4]
MKRVLMVLLLTLAACHSLPSPAEAELAAARTQYWQHPYQPESINRLAMLLAERGDKATAALLLERALLISPGRDDIRANLERVRRGERRAAASAPATIAAAAQAPTAASVPAAQPKPIASSAPLPSPWPLADPVSW